MKSIILISIGLALYSCFDANYKSYKNSAKHQFIQKEYKAKCIYNDHSYLEVITKYIEVPDTISRYGIYVLSQDIIVHYNNEIKVVDNPMDKVQNIQIGSETLSVKSTLLVGAECLNNDKEVIYKIHGSDCIDPPHEFFGYLSIEGKWNNYYYGSQHEVYKKLGSNKKIIEKFGKKSNSLKGMINMLPK